MNPVIVLPTYNERGNIERFLTAVRSATDAYVLVVDDSSPDGTAEAARSLAEELGRINVMTRPAKDGLGSAYRAGFDEVLSGRLTDDDDHPFDVVISMDADLSHDPAVIPTMLAMIEAGADAVVGSRYVTGGGTTDWPVRRQLLSRWGNRYTKAALGLRVNDSTSGFRAYRAEALAKIAPSSTRAEGYAFLTELVRRLNRSGALIQETPIVFRDRTAGTSKMSGRIIAESMMLVTLWGLRDRWRTRSLSAR